MKLLTMPCRNTVHSTTPNDTAANVLPQVWATEGNLAHAIQPLQREAERQPQLRAVPNIAAAASEATTREQSRPVSRAVLAPQTAFYRTYTEAMLRRYAVLSMESGRVPSMLGREMFRGKVTSYRVHAFDDVVIFCHDVENCIRQLEPRQQRLIQRIAVQEYTFGEAAGMFSTSLRSVQRHYHEAIDELTAIFLQRRLLERIATDPCQGDGGSAELVSRMPA